MAAGLQGIQSFYLLSLEARSRGKHHVGAILPPLMNYVLNDVLHAHGFVDGIDIFHLAEGEGDAYCVSLARELGAYGLGLDSDFAILGACEREEQGEDGYQGYIPMNTLQWIVKDSNPLQSLDDDDDDGFSTVTAKKNKRGKSSATNSSVDGLVYHPGVVPPGLDSKMFQEAEQSLTLQGNVFPPSCLPTRLRIPASHMGVVATLLGTDHTTSIDSALFFPSNLSANQRVDRVAAAIREALMPGAVARYIKARTQSSSHHQSLAASLLNTEMTRRLDEAITTDPLFAFMATTVDKLLVRTPMASDGALLTLVTTLIEASCHYILPPSPTHLGLCVLGAPGFNADQFSMFPFVDCFPRREILPLTLGDNGATDVSDLDKNALDMARRHYARARNSGYLTHFESYSTPDRCYLMRALADPDQVSPQGSIEAVRIRAESWRVLIEAVRVLPYEADEQDDEEAGSEEEEDESLHDMEDHSSQTSGHESCKGTDQLMPDVQEIDSSQSLINGQDDTDSPGRFTITEFYRTGSSTSRIGPHLLNVDIDIQTRPSPIALESIDDRWTYLIDYVSAFDPSVSPDTGLEPDWQLVVALLRLTVRIAASQGRMKSRLKVFQVRRLAIAAVKSRRTWTSRRAEHEGQTMLELHRANCALVGLCLSAGLEINQLAQALRLQGAERHCFVEPPNGGDGEGQEWQREPNAQRYSVDIYKFIEGTVYHSTLLADREPSVGEGGSELIDRIVRQVCLGMEELVLGAPRGGGGDGQEPAAIGQPMLYSEVQVDVESPQEAPQSRNQKAKKGKKQKNNATTPAGGRFALLAMLEDE